MTKVWSCKNWDRRKKIAGVRGSGALGQFFCSHPNFPSLFIWEHLLHRLGAAQSIVACGDNNDS